MSELEGGWIRDEFYRAHMRNQALPPYARPTVTRPIAGRAKPTAVEKTTPRLRLGDWMQTFTGIAFWPLDPESSDIDGLDIAHALGLICRYGGHVRRFYSVAEHCLLMSAWVEKVAGPTEALKALLHDATEAYVGDVIRPLKHLPEFYEYRQIEDRLMDVICHRFGLKPGESAIVKEADNRILLNERLALMVMPPPLPWGPLEKLDPLPQTYVRGLPPDQATGTYYARLNELLDMQP